jgi:hypothetical protein
MMHRRVVFVSLGMLMPLCGCESVATTSGRSASAAHAKGVQEAREALAAGVLRLKEYPPLPSPLGHAEYIRLLKERCGVDYEVPELPKGTAEADFVQEIRGWNQVMEAEIRKRFGNDILQQLREEARPKRGRNAPRIKV